MPTPAFTGTKPKAYNHRYFIDIGVTGTPDWQELCHGIASRGNDIGDDTEEYFYMCGRGAADVDASSQTFAVTFSGNRFLGDPAQDAIFIDRLFNMDTRQVRVIDYYDNMPTSLIATKGNGWQGTATILISDSGSGDAAVRESIEFSLQYNGAPTRGTVTVDAESNEPTFAPLAPAA